MDDSRSKNPGLVRLELPRGRFDGEMVNLAFVVIHHCNVVLMYVSMIFINNPQYGPIMNNICISIGCGVAVEATCQQFCVLCVDTQYFLFNSQTTFVISDVLLVQESEWSRIGVMARLTLVLFLVQKWWGKPSEIRSWLGTETLCSEEWGVDKFVLCCRFKSNWGLLQQLRPMGKTLFHTLPPFWSGVEDKLSGLGIQDNFVISKLSELADIVWDICSSR